MLRAGVSVLRITSNDDSKNLAILDGTGNIITPKGDLNKTIDAVGELQRQAFTAKPPKTSHDPCQAGTKAADTEYIYVCVADNQWRRAKLSTW